MKLSLALIGLALTSIAFTMHEGALHIGDKAPMSDTKMKAVSGDMMSLADMAGENGLLVMFSCNTCPFVVGNAEKSEGWENRYNEYYAVTQKAQMGMVLINSNEAKREAGDSFKDMQIHAEQNDYQMEYLLDANHVLADAFGAKTTPHVFLFDKNMQLVYTGAIDDNVNKREDVKEKYLFDAIAAVVDGKDVPVKQTKPVGCSIKRVKK